MAKLGRVLQKIFGINATTGGVGVGQLSQIGSFAAASPTTENPTDAGALAVQGNSNYLGGWFFCVSGGNSPVMEDMNSLHFLVTRQLAYLFQEGVAEWDATTTYYVGSIVQDGSGNLYASKQNTNLNKVLSNAAYWQPLKTGLNPQCNQVLATRAASLLTQASIAPTTLFSDVTWSEELKLFVAAGSVLSGANCFATSPDGKTWTARTAPGTNTDFDSVCWSPELGIFVSINNGGSSTNGIATSPDGTTWTGHNAPTTAVIRKIIWSPELAQFVAFEVVLFSGSAKLWLSSDGVTWVSGSVGTVLGTGSQSLAVAWSPSLELYCVIMSPLSATTTDFATFVTGTIPSLNYASVIWCEEKSMFVAVQSAASGSPLSATSPDGLNWTQGPTNGKASNVIWCKELGVFVAIDTVSAANTAYYISFDGLTWTAETVASDKFSRLCWSPELGIFVAVGSGSSKGYYSRYVKKFIAP